MKVVVRTPNWLGDAVMAIPAVRYIKHSIQGEVWVFTKQSISPLWEMIEEVDTVLGFEDQWAPFFMLSQYKFDKGILLTNSFRSALHFFIARIPERRGVKRYARGWLLTEGIKFIPELQRKHQIDYYLEIAGVEDKTAVPCSMVPDPPDPVKERAIKLLSSLGWEGEEIVCVHPLSSYGPAKNWFIDRYRLLAQELHNKYKVRIIIIGTNREKEVLDRVFKGKHIINTAGYTDLKTLIGVLSLCKYFIGNDSGPLHLASSIRIPCIGIFGSTDPARTAPRGERIYIIRKQISCSPCLQRTCPKEMECFKKIKVDDVLQKVTEIES